MAVKRSEAGPEGVNWRMAVGLPLLSLPGLCTPWPCTQLVPLSPAWRLLEKQHFDRALLNPEKLHRLQGWPCLLFLGKSGPTHTWRALCLNQRGL